jgi:hypothetical protein
MEQTPNGVHDLFCCMTSGFLASKVIHVHLSTFGSDWTRDSAWDERGLPELRWRLLMEIIWAGYMRIASTSTVFDAVLPN